MLFFHDDARRKFIKIDFCFFRPQIEQIERIFIGQKNKNPHLSRLFVLSVCQFNEKLCDLCR